MQYYLSAYVEDCRKAEKYHEVSILFNNLKEAESYYNQFNGKEIFDEEILINDAILVPHSYNNSKTGLGSLQGERLLKSV